MIARALKTLLPLLPCILFLALPQAKADYYQYKDGSGTVCITNKLESVPAKYRGAMLVTRDQAVAKEGPAAHREAAPARAAAEEPPLRVSMPESVAPAPATGRFADLAARYPWFKPLAIVCGVCVGFFLVVKLGALLPSRQFSRLLNLAFFVGVFVFAYKSYADHVAGSYLGIKAKVLAMFQKANEREGLQPPDKLAEAAGEAPANPPDAASQAPGKR